MATLSLAHGPLVLTLIGSAGLGYFLDRLLPTITGDAYQIHRSADLSSAKPISGRASVIDGDTLQIGAETVRLNGIDAPETTQLCQKASGADYHCGAMAAKALNDFVAASTPTSCSNLGRDQYGRYLGDCQRADGQSVNRWLVRNGFARDWVKYSGGVYSKDEFRAQRERLGIWVGRFTDPWQWRIEQATVEPKTHQIVIPPRIGGEVGKVASDPQPPRTNCKIKGNVSDSGERIYHVPGQKFYRRTVISENQGERWFCSEPEARRAGWRRALR